MTAVRAHPAWSLPHRAFPTQPTDRDGQVPWAVESLLGLYVDSDEPVLVDVIHAFRPDLSHSELWEALERLCALSSDVADMRDSSAGRWAAFDVLQDEYATALSKLATRPAVSS